MFKSKKPMFAKSTEEIDGVRKAANIIKIIKEETDKMISIGTTLKEIEELAKKIMEENEAISATYKYNGYPSHICTSVNEVLVHGIPSDYKLKNGDLVTIDISLSLNGYFADSAYTKIVGEFKTKRDQELYDTSKEILQFMIRNAKPGVKLKELGRTVEAHVNKKGFSVSYDFVGHGIGKSLHEDPSVPNFYDNNNNSVLEENMIICLEPMIMMKSNKIFIDPIDNWTARSVDGENNVHDEETVLITKMGGEILTNK